MRRLQRVPAELGHAEVGRAADDGDLGDEEAHLRRVDREARRLDIDGEVRSRDLARRNPGRVGAHPGGNAGARLAALLVAHEREADVAGEPHAGAVEHAQRGEAGGDSGLEIAGTATPDRAVDHRRGEGVLPLGALPVLPPAVHVHGVGVPDEKEARPAASAAPLAPDVRAAGQEVGGPHVLDPAPPHLGGEEAGEARLVAGDALVADGAAQQCQRVVAVERRRQPVVERPVHAVAPASRGGGSDSRASGASAPKSALCRCPSPIAAAPISAACGPSRLGVTATGAGMQAGRSARTRSISSGRTPIEPPRTTSRGLAIAAMAAIPRARSRAVSSSTRSAAASPSAARAKTSGTADILRGERRIAGADAGRGDQPLEGAGPERLRLEGVGAERQEAELARRVVRAPNQLAADDQPAADAGAERDEGEVVEPLARPLPGLALNGEVHVVLEQHVAAERRLQRGRHVHPVEPGDVRREPHPAGRRIGRSRHAGHRDADPLARHARRRGRLAAKAGDLVDHRLPALGAR